MHFENDYFENDIREGFFIPGMIKRSWAMQLEVLEKIDKICEDENLKWYAAFGTLIGAVRHRGFIPWDDDLDICMLREDYEKFLLVAQKKLPKEYRVLSIETVPEYNELFARVTCSDNINISNQYLMFNHGFPFVAGIDIFPMDYLSTDDEYEKQRIERVHCLRALMNNWTNDSREVEEKINEAETISGYKFERGLPIRTSLLKLIQKIISEVDNENSVEITNMSNYIYNNSLRYKLEWYKERLDLPFERTYIKVPARYIEVLEASYKDWYIARRGTGAHDYPFYNKQEEQLRNQTGRSLYRYIPDVYYENENLVDTISKEHETYIQNIIENIKQLKEAAGFIFNKYEIIDEASLLEFLGKCQQLAIQVGEQIEQGWGIGINLVSHFEALCELLYKVFCHIGVEGVNDISGLWEPIVELTQKIYDEFVVLSQKKHILFTVVRKKDADYLKRILETYLSDESYHVNYIIIPYYDRNNDGSIGAIHYEEDIVLEGVIPLSYEAFLKNTIIFDEILFQHPFDDNESAFTVEPHFYSKCLKRRSKQLVYIHSLDLYGCMDEISRVNAKYYVIAPGVLSADSIRVPNQEIYNLYRSILSANDLGQHVAKIIIDNRLQKVKERKMSCEKKNMIVYMGVDILHNLPQRMDVIERCVDILSNHQGDLDAHWVMEDICTEELQDAYETIRAMIKRKTKLNVEFCSIDSIEKSIEYMDAYYGSGGYLMNICILNRIPAMVCK